MFRRTQLLTIFLLVAMVIAACGGTAPSTGSTTSPSAAASEQAAPASVAAEASVSEAAEARERCRGGPLTVAVLENTVVAPSEAAAASMPSDMAADQTLRYVTRGFSRMDPASEGGFGRFVISHMWMPLFLRDSENTLMPWLATGYEVNDDKTVYTVSIDPRAVWSDGSPVLAQEAIDYWAYGLDPVRCEGCYLSAFAGFDVIEGAKDVIDGNSQTISGITATDEKTLEFKLTGPDPLFIHRLALFDSGFVKMEDVNKGPTYASDGSARVNGPFMIKTWNVDEKTYEIVQNPEWWGDKKPLITSIIAQEAADENISFVQWQNNEVDVALFLTNIREQMRADQADTFYQMPYATNLFFPLWLKVAPMDDLNLRKALIHAVDWDAAIAAAWEGARDDRVMKSILTPELQCYKPDNWPEWGYDPEKAKQELAASKYATPDQLGKIRITTNGQSPNYIRMAEIIAEQWKNNLGITDVEIKPGPLDAWGQELTRFKCGAPARERSSPTR